MKRSPAARKGSALPPHRHSGARGRALTAQGREIIRLEIGKRGFFTPKPLVRAAKRTTGHGEVHYAGRWDCPGCARRLPLFIRMASPVPAGLSAVTPGASGVLLLALGVVLDAGDVVLVANPGYPCNRHFAGLLDAVPARIPLGPETAF